MHRAFVRLCLQHGYCMRRASTEAASDLQEPALQLSPEVVAFVSRRGQGTVAMPAELVRAVEKAVGRRESPHRTLQDASTQLTGDLRNRDHWKNRSELKQMLKKLVAAGPMPADRVDIAAEQVHASSESRRKTRLHREDPMAYDDSAAAAYAASRMPACYAVVRRIMAEMAFTQPDWRPRTMLDFGAGPATAAWAAAEIWDGHPRLEVQAVEQSQAMAELGHETGQEMPAGGPDIRWSSSLPGLGPLSQRTSKGRQEQMRGRPTRKHDLVTACYVLSEIEDASKRRRVVEALWQSTGNTLLIAEPGTPIGSSIIREARWQILTTEGAAGAHVQAPCPHDGICPMDGSKSWCHFRQRFQRPPLQRRSRRPTNNTAPRSYQDERFSYVVLKRGPRQSPVEAVVGMQPTGLEAEPIQVDGDRMPEGHDEEGLDWEIGERNSDGDSMGLVSKSDHPSLEQDLSPLDPAAELAVLESMEWGPQSDDDDSGRPEIEDGEAGAGHMVLAQLFQKAFPKTWTGSL
ncbi:hypothetical protein WJX84_001218 [Apatococcus fuscideae]|uniref:Uncharacterized protein n=1 Tax=Apatococcus fuscideae TaxID=2026836 RepID=A0AAW1T6Q5_9CHLO